MADTKISALTEKTTPVGSDQYVIAESGGGNKKVLGSSLYGLPEGRSGATAAARFVGATASGAPASGTFAVGDFIVDQSGAIYVCTGAGSPGTWVTIGGGPTVLFDSTLGSAASSIDTGANGIAGGYDVLHVYALLRTTEAVVQSSALITLNNDTGSNYDRTRLTGQNASAGANTAVAAANWSVLVHGAGGSSGYATALFLVMPGYTQTTFNKVATAMIDHIDGTAASSLSGKYALGWRNTAAVTRMAIAAGSGNLDTGSRLLIYGL